MTNLINVDTNVDTSNPDPLAAEYVIADAIDDLAAAVDQLATRIEELRRERDACARYPGAVININAALGHVVEEYDEAIDNLRSYCKQHGRPVPYVLGA